MKIIIALLTMLTLLSGAKIDEFAAKVGYLRDYKEGVKTAKEQNKMLMLLVVGDYCPWCKKFERKTLMSDPVKARVNEDVIAVVIDKYKDKGHYPKEFYAPLIPAVFFIDPKSEKSLLETVAYMKKTEFMENMDDAKSLYAGEKK